MPRPIINDRAFRDRRLAAVDAHLRARLSDPKRLPLEYAAHVASVSPEHLCRIFHERAGVCFTDWQCAVRTEHAKRLIVERSMRINAVARAVGYSDQSTFGRVFRRYEGVTPRQIRPFVDAYPELSTAVCACTAEFVFRIGPLCVRDPEVLALLHELLNSAEQRIEPQASAPARSGDARKWADTD